MTSLPLSSGLFGRSICLELLETCPHLGHQEKPPSEGSLSWIQRLGGCWSGGGGENALAAECIGPPEPLQRQRGECVLARESEEEGTVPAHAGSSGQDENVLLVKHDDGFWSRCEQQALRHSSGLAPLSTFSEVNIQHSTARRP